MIQSTSQLIEELSVHVKDAIQFGNQLKQLSTEELTWRASEQSWNILECIEHLNRYSDFYLPEIQKEIKSSNHPPENTFKSGWLGNYFANSMLPSAKGNAMKTFKDKNPLGASLNTIVLDVFLKQQHELLALLEESKKVSLCKTRIKISIAKWVKIRLGDTFRFVIYHNIRHTQQVEKILKNQKAF